MGCPPEVLVVLRKNCSDSRGLPRPTSGKQVFSSAGAGHPHGMADLRLALVTGASSGIGYELAQLLAEEGWDLVLAAEDDELAPAAAAIRAHGRQVTECRTDLSTPAGVERLWAAVQELGTPLDAALLNAGVGLGRSFVEQDLDRALEVVDLNVRSTVHLAHLVLRQ